MFLTGGKALMGLGVLPDYQTLSNSEYPYSEAQQTDGGREVSSSRGKEPRPSAKVPKSTLSGKRCGDA